MKKTFLLALIGLCLAALPLRAQEVEDLEQPAEPEKPKSEKTYDRARIVLSFWSTNYLGDMEVVQQEQVLGQDVMVGEDLDLVDDFGLENPKDAVDIAVWIRLGKRSRIHLSWFTVDYGGEENLDVPVEFAGYQFAVNTDLETVWRISRFRLVHEFNPWWNEKGRLGFIWGVDYFVWELGYKGTETSSGLRVDETEYLPIPVPVVGMSGALNFGYGFGGEASVSGISVDLGPFSASYTDFNIGLTYDYKWFHAGVGYRLLDSRLDAEGDDDDLEIHWATSQQGMILGIGVNI